VKWDLLRERDGRPGPENMAVDQALLEEAGHSGRAYLRLYRWTPSCLSFGRNEPALTRYDRAEIERRGISVVRRPTGGRAVWHDRELTYAVAAPIAVFGTLAQAYRVIHERIATALGAVGVVATVAPAARPESIGAGACFASAVGGEVVAGTGKIVGSAQVSSGAAFLQHGSILLDGSQELVRSVTRGPVPAGGETTLSKLANRAVSFDEVADAIVSSWTPPPVPAPTPSVLPGRFAEPDWTWRR
jgi:lipoyl(octanoyl) transferase